MSGFQKYSDGIVCPLLPNRFACFFDKVWEVGEDNGYLTMLHILYKSRESFLDVLTNGSRLVGGDTQYRKRAPTLF